MAWSVQPAGEWSVATTDDPDTDMPAALALPGTWQWKASLPHVAYVHKDQVANLTPGPAPVTITGYTPDPFVMPGSGTIHGTGLMAVTELDFVDEGLNSFNQCFTHNQTDTSIDVEQAAPNQAYPQFIYIQNASGTQLAPLFPIDTA